MANKRRLDTRMESDFLQSFVRGVTSTSDEKPMDATAVEEKHQKISEPVVKVLVEDPKAKKDEKEPPKVCEKFANSHPPKKGPGKKEKKRRRLKCEELYTDKDRAAAVNMGTKDIKQSLKLKRQQDRSKTLHIPQEANPAQFLALGYYEMKKNAIKIALSFINKALELNPEDKNALVARSKCYILLGQPEDGLKDAEAALELDKKFLKAIYQKAESLYYLGDFEYSLMYFHRGLHIRPDHEDFKAGVEKAQKAIETALGINNNHKTNKRSKSATPILRTNTPKSDTKLNDNNNNLNLIGNNNKAAEIVNKSNGNRSRSRSRPKTGHNRLLRELAVDKEYLEHLLNDPELKQQENQKIFQYIEQTVQFLNKRQEFWRQQLPPNRKI